MITFKSYLAEAAVNSHLTHLEDLVFDMGVEGTRRAIFFLRDVRDMLSQSSGDKKTVATVKWDGCLHEDTILWTNHGDMSIKTLYEHPEIWESTYLMGKDLEGEIKICKLSKLIDMNKKENSEKQWVEISLENGAKITLTSDHLVYTKNRGWVEASNLTADDDIDEL